jgi:hypothetical protein
MKEFKMIRHIVFFSVKSSIGVDAVEQNLKKLGQIRHSSHFEVVRNSKVDPMCDRIDLVVYAEFRDEHALAAYKADPLYDQTTRKVRPLRELRFSADYRVPKESKIGVV